MGIFGSILGGISKAGSILSIIGQGVQVVEAITKPLKSSGSIASADKQAMARTFVKSAIQESEMFSGKDIIDEEAFDKALNQIIDGVVAAMNAVKG